MTNTRSIYDTPYIIYKHTNTITGKSYIGKTVQGAKRRWKQHLSDSKTRSINSHFHKAIRKYGTDLWKHEILFVSFKKDDDYLYEIEKKLIKRYDTIDNGYNILVGGRGVGSGAEHPWFERKHSEESKQKMSDTQKGVLISEKTKQKIREATKGEKNHLFRGYYQTPWGRFSSIDSGATELCGEHSVHNWCKNSDKVISVHSIVKSKYLLSLPESPIGKTYSNIGFDFIQCV